MITLIVNNASAQ